jgi:acyl carrier protein
MDYASFQEEFLIACDFIDEPVLSAESRLNQIPDFDSLAMLGVIVLLETQFGLTATGDQIMSQETLGGLHKFAVQKISG